LPRCRLRRVASPPPPAAVGLHSDVDTRRSLVHASASAARPVMLVADSLRDGGRRRTVRPPVGLALAGPPADHAGRTIRHGWYDTESGDLVDEAELVALPRTSSRTRRHPRFVPPTGAMTLSCVAAACERVPDKDFTSSFPLSPTPAVRPFRSDTLWFLPVPFHRLAGLPASWHRDSRAARRSLSRTVGRRSPPGFEPGGVGRHARHGHSIDRVARWNARRDRRCLPIVGFHADRADGVGAPGLVASSQGTGMGGMTSMATMYTATYARAGQAELPFCRKCCRTSLRTRVRPYSAATAQ